MLLAPCRRLSLVRLGSTSRGLGSGQLLRGLCEPAAAARPASRRTASRRRSSPRHARTPRTGRRRGRCRHRMAKVPRSRAHHARRRGPGRPLTIFLASAHPPCRAASHPLGCGRWPPGIVRQPRFAARRASRCRVALDLVRAGIEACESAERGERARRLPPRLESIRFPDAALARAEIA
jgi:hypothetical protein